jgi:hypothetical protein
MKEFNTINQLASSFIDGDFDLEPEFSLADIKYQFSIQSDTTIAECISGKRPFAIYESPGVSQIVLFWAADGNTIIPGGAISVTNEDTQFATEEFFVEMDDGQKITIRPDQLIGDIAMVKFTSLSSPKELQGKVDTGATISSLHADHYKINGNTVTFVCEPLGPNSLTVPLKTQHAVKSPDGGTHYRPVVVLNVKVNGKLLNNIEFNLNDRGNMDQPVLIGQNLLQTGKFYVDPSRKEAVEYNWNNIDKLIEAIQIDVKEKSKDKDISELYQKMLETNISFRDLVHYMKSEVTKTDLEY